jgi:hypothetical protein
MLIEFRVENHRSLRDEQVLSMEAANLGEPSDKRPRKVVGHATPLLPAVGLYGANASGKSNVLSALAFMREAVILSHRYWSPDGGVPRDQFAWGVRKAEPSLYEVTLLINGVRFQYGFQASDEAFLEEWLHAWPHGKKQVWFERDGAKFKFGDHLKGENRLIEEVTRPNALFLSAAVQHRHEQLATLFAWFQESKTVGVDPGTGARGSALARAISRDLPFEILVAGMIEIATSPRRSGSHDVAARMFEEFRNLLKRADIGIVDVGVEQDIFNNIDSPGTHVSFKLKHLSTVEESWLPLERESNGTKTLFRLGVPILAAMDQGAVLLVDELEASLHPALARQIVRQFNDPATNPRNAQLIFTTHDTNLLGTTDGDPVLRRDQVWLTEKDGEGATVLYPLTDFKPRKAENLERGYLQGRYGAIPFLGDFVAHAD